MQNWVQRETQVISPDLVKNYKNIQLKKVNVNSKSIKEASKKKRLLNYIIDLTVRFFLFFLLLKITDYFESNEIIKKTGFAFIFGGYYILMEYFLGKTIGKIITKTKVIDVYGNKIDFRTSVIRYLCRWIPFEPFSLGLGYDAKAWHDTLSKTYVIEDKQN